MRNRENVPASDQTGELASIKENSLIKFDSYLSCISNKMLGMMTHSIILITVERAAFWYGISTYNSITREVFTL